jgi:hypothetical protein
MTDAMHRCGGTDRTDDRPLIATMKRWRRRAPTVSCNANVGCLLHHLLAPCMQRQFARNGDSPS